MRKQNVISHNFAFWGASFSSFTKAVLGAGAHTSFPFKRLRKGKIGNFREICFFVVPMKAVLRKGRLRKRYEKIGFPKRERRRCIGAIQRFRSCSFEGFLRELRSYVQLSYLNQA